MTGVPPSESTFDAGVSCVRPSGLVRNHAHEFVSAQFGNEGAPDSAIGAGGLDLAGRNAEIDHRLLLERRRRARLDTGTTRHALALQERDTVAGRYLRPEATAGDGQRERPLHLRTGPNASTTRDALALVEREVRVGFILWRVKVVHSVHAVADIAQPDNTRHVLQFAVAIRRTRQTVQRMIGDVQLHDALAQLVEFGSLRLHRHAIDTGRGARRRGSGLAVDLDQAQPARPERLERIRCAQLGYGCSG